MFHYADGLKITALDLAIDFRRRQPRGFISHAHADHMAAHELAFCTPETAALYQHRLGRRAVHELPFREPYAWDGLRLTTFPAGHILGSAMLLVEHENESLLYTGDFKLAASMTAEATELPQATTLVMESTFGEPQYRLPPRHEVVDELVSTVQRSLAVGVTPVIFAYVLGKAQEVTKILTSRGIAVAQHPEIFALSRVYESLGCSLGNVTEYSGENIEADTLPRVIIMPPRGQRSAKLPLPSSIFTIAVTGWANDKRAKFRLGVDYAIPLSDHADYDELVECVERVSPKIIYCTHGPESFVERLRDLGHNAYPLARKTQLRLF